MLLLLLLIFGILVNESTPDEMIMKNRIIYYIHGDGDYLFHNREGKQLQSDEMILQQALDNAQKGVNSEYFIFHHKPKRTFLIFFPGEESVFYHFKNGNLIAEKKYFRFDPVEGHSAESYLLKEANPASAAKNIFLYYGHEIPIEEEYGYNASFPEVPFGLKSLSGRISEIYSTLNEQKFDLFVLSTCNNGSPEFIQELSKLADYIIASPTDLHLSQMNSKYLQQLEHSNFPNSSIALQFAFNAYEELIKLTFTEVAISVYNSERLFILRDKAELICSDPVLSKETVTVFFRPSKFGKYKDKESHSGWYCKEKDLVLEK